MGQDHNMSSNLAGKGPKRTLCVLRTPKDVQDQRPTDMITCQSGRGEQYASRLVYVHDTVKQVKLCIFLTCTMLHMLAGLFKPLAPLGCQYLNHIIEGPVNIYSSAHSASGPMYIAILRSVGLNLQIC